MVKPHGFDPNLACRYGVDEAIVIHSFQWWIGFNRSNRHNFRDGRTWTFNSYAAWKEHFPYWNAHKIRRVLESLVAQKVLVQEKFEQAKGDVRNWYAFLDERQFLDDYPHLAKMQSGGPDLPDGLAEMQSGLANLPALNKDPVCNTVRDAVREGGTPAPATASSISASTPEPEPAIPQASPFDGLDLEGMWFTYSSGTMAPGTLRALQDAVRTYDRHGVRFTQADLEVIARDARAYAGRGGKSLDILLKQWEIFNDRRTPVVEGPPERSPRPAYGNRDGARGRQESERDAAVRAKAFEKLQGMAWYTRKAS